MVNEAVFARFFDRYQLKEAARYQLEE